MAKGKTNFKSRQNTARDFRPAHEKQTAFPPGLKRPDPNATVEGRSISNDAQRQLFDDIKANRCTRCHKEGHHRAKCTLAPVKWEEKFDREKNKYWESVAKWQAKAAAEPKPGAAPVAPKPTLIPKKESRRTEITFEECAVPLECLITMMHSFADSDLDSDPDDDALPTTRPLAYAALHALFPDDSDSADDAPLFVHR
jgi:hypothetical protein